MDTGSGFRKGVTSLSLVAGATSVKLRAVLNTAISGVSYQWRRDGAAMHGQGGQTLDISSDGIMFPVWEADKDSTVHPPRP